MARTPGTGDMDTVVNRTRFHLPPEAPITATDLFAALVVEKFLVAMAEMGFAKRENILAAMVATVTKRSMRLSAARTPENARDGQVICCRCSGAAAANGDSVRVSCSVAQKPIKIRARRQKYHTNCKICMI